MVAQRAKVVKKKQAGSFGAAGDWAGLRDGLLLHRPLLLDGLAPWPHVRHSPPALNAPPDSSLAIVSKYSPIHISLFQREVVVKQLRLEKNEC